MNFTLNEIILLGTFIISIVALAFSTLAFFRGRNFDLQNQLYLKKLEAYEAIIGEFFKLLKLMRRNYEKLLSLDLQHLSELEKDQLNNLSYQIDSDIDQIQETIVLKSIYFSEEFMEKVVASLQTFYGDFDWGKSENDKDAILLMDSYITKQTKELEILINHMGIELGLKELNGKLLKRIEKGIFKFDV